jgi:hypothetical protein
MSLIMGHKNEEGIMWKKMSLLHRKKYGAMT